MKKGVVINNISKRHGDAVALSEVSFSVQQGEFFSILGPSGCGKTTLLRILAGFDKPDSGKIFLDGVDITDLPPNKRPINTVFQNYALFPHLTIWENIAFGLRVAKKPEREIRLEVDKMLHLIQMPEHANKFPEQISGGQKQRVAIARALINQPRVLLLDEPLAALDLKLRQKMLIDLDIIHDEVGITFIFVTHDQSEAMALSDRIAVLHNGVLQQLGAPVEIYEMPQNPFVADFIGDTNFFDGCMSETVKPDYSLLTFDGYQPVICFNDKQLTIGDLVHLSVRPEKIHISREKPPHGELVNLYEGIVDELVYKGDHTHYAVLVGDHKIKLQRQHSRFLLDETPIRWQDKVWIWWHADDGFILAKEKGTLPP